MSQGGTGVSQGCHRGGTWLKGCTPLLWNDERVARPGRRMRRLSVVQGERPVPPCTRVSVFFLQRVRTGTLVQHERTVSPGPSVARPRWSNSTARRCLVLFSKWLASALKLTLASCLSASAQGVKLGRSLYDARMSASERRPAPSAPVPARFTRPLTAAAAADFACQAAPATAESACQTAGPQTT